MSATAPTSCAEIAIHLGDPPRGTAPETRLWLAIEDPGPWGPAGITESTIDPGLATELAQRTDAAGVRIQLIRQRRDATTGERAVYLARSVPGGTWLRSWTTADPRELLELPWDRLERRDPPDVGRAAEGPIVLVCTHARRDACCARYGRPVAAAAVATAPSTTWETSHTGGHRFAGNLVLLPEGLVYGRLQPADVAHVLDSHLRGLVDLPRYRGRSADPRPAQAADWFLRERLGLTGIEDVRVQSVTDDGRGGGTVILAATGRRYAVDVERRTTDTPRPLSCDEPGEDPGAWHLGSIEELTATDA